MSRMIAMCGLICGECIAFIATQKDDDKLREKVVEAWSSEEDRLELKDVDCDGCMMEKRLHSFCRVCEVKKCGLQRSIENCAYCSEFPCKRLEELWEGFRTVSAEKAKTTLVEIRKQISVTV